MAHRVRPWTVLAALLVVATPAACGGDDDESRTESGVSAGKLAVVTTVAPITSIAANVAGDLADIQGVVPEGTNSHTFEPAPSVAEVLSKADLIFINGLSLEEPTKKLARENMKSGAKIVELGTEVLPESEWIYDFSFPKEEGKPNPHLWTDPTFVKKYADVIRRELSAKDAANAPAYQRNYDAFAALIDEFDKAMRTSFATLPAYRRKLLTYHDAYAYFAKTYDWDVIGAIQVENFEDPSPKEVAELIDQVKVNAVPAIFGSEVFPSPVLEQIGKEAGVKYVDVLRDDDLPGQPGDVEHSWLGLMRFDYVTMVEALGGDAATLKAFQVRNVATDKAVYPQ
ncbi:MAG TPA: metal ABC transporter substrate-binding protein [Acidimicrobiia bacterium]|nr:metal ABC transporter substrate-binding protein [Acidimicrobiia bacterium]